MLMSRLIQLSQAIDAAIDRLGKAVTWLILLTIAVGFYNVTMRYIGRFVGTSLSSNALIELQWYLFSLMFCLGFAYILKHGSNVRVDFLYSHWNLKHRAWIDLVGTVLFLIPFCILGLWVSWGPILQSWGYLPDGSWGTWEMSSDANGLPRAPIKTMIIVAFATLLIQSISQTIKYLAILQGYTQVADRLEQDAETAHLE